MTVAEAGCTSLSEAYQETLEYFAKQYCTQLSTWAVSIECQPWSGRFKLVQAPLGPVELKVSLTWRRFLPPCFHSSKYYAQNRNVNRKLLSDIDAYGYSIDELREMEVEPGIIAKLEVRLAQERSLRIKDVIPLLHFIRLSPQERTRVENIEDEGLEASRLRRHQQVTEDTSRRRLGEQARSFARVSYDDRMTRY